MTTVSTGDGPMDGVLAAGGIDPAARGALYGLLATTFEPPGESFHASLTDGSFEAMVRELIDRTTLEVDPEPVRIDDDPDQLAARYHDLFVIGYAEYEDRTDGSLSTAEPPVPLYATAYRTDVSWGDVNLDLARAYDYYGLEIDTDRRDHHDSLRLQLQFAGYLSRREAAVDDSAATARLDFLDRHLRPFVESVRDRLADEPGPGGYAGLLELLDQFTAADRADLVARLEGDG